MATKVVGLPGIHEGNISDRAGIRPHQTDAAFASTSEFQAAKGSGGQTSAMEAGDWYLNSANGYSLDVQGAANLQQMNGVSATTLAGATVVSAGNNITLGTLVGAPGAGRVVVPRAIFGSLAAGTAWTAGSPFVVCYGGVGGPSATVALTSGAIDADATTQSFFRVNLEVLSGLPAASVADQSLVLARSGSVVGTAARALTMTVVYDILTV